MRSMLGCQNENEASYVDKELGLRPGNRCDLAHEHFGLFQACECFWSVFEIYWRIQLTNIEPQIIAYCNSW